MDVADLLTGVLALIGATFTLLAGVGVLRFPDTLSRMHAATKATTLGLLLIVSGAVAQLSGGSTKLGFAVGLVFLTSPVAAHLVARSSYRAHGVGGAVAGIDELAEAEARADTPPRYGPGDAGGGRGAGGGGPAGAGGGGQRGDHAGDRGAARPDGNGGADPEGRR